MISGRGVNAHVPSNGEIDYAARIGCEWIRIDFNWRSIEGIKGVFQWGPYDSAISYAKKCGMKVYVSLAYVPTWINADYRTCPDIFNWSYFCTKVALRYGSKIDVYSLWNEPNLESFFTGTKEQYVKNILIPGYKSIKSVSPNLVVAAADLSTASKSRWNGWFRFLAKKAEYYDIFSWHIYADSPNAVSRRFKWGKFPIIGWIVPKWRPISWTVFGIAKKRRVFLTETGLKASAGSSKEQERQLEFAKGLAKMAKDTKSSAVFYYDLKDNSLFKEKWGLFDERGNPKKAAVWLMNN